MKYITGIHALNMNCKLDTCGDWHQSALKWEDITFRESDDSVFKEYGIESGNRIPVDDKLYYSANTIRALLDLINEGNFVTAQGMREDFICNEKYTEEVLNKVWELRDNNNWSNIDKFMSKEYMLEWAEFKERQGERIC